MLTRSGLVERTSYAIKEVFEEKHDINVTSRSLRDMASKWDRYC